VLTVAFYALAQYDIAAASVALVATPTTSDASVMDRLWLEANIAAHREVWKTAEAKFSEALTASHGITDERRIHLYANLGLAQRQLVLEKKERQIPCSPDPVLAYSEAIVLAEQLSSATANLPLLYTGRGFSTILLSCNKKR
jgi:hypothetical protein